VQSDVPVVLYLVLLPGVSAAFAWLYNSTGGSVAIVALCHACFNASVGTLFLTLPAGSGVAFFVTCAALAWAIALALVPAFGSQTLTAAPRCPAARARSYEP
jgi:hypothetical protein